MKKKNKNNKMMLLVVIFFMAAITAIIGYTYSFFQATVTNTNTISGEVEVIKFALNVEKISPEENKDRNLIPQLDNYVSKAVTGVGNKTCLDANGNVICNVYKITLENEASSAIYINGDLELTAPNMPNLRWAEINSPSNPTLKSAIHDASHITLASNDLFEGFETKVYYIVVWISEKGEAQTDRGSYSGVVTFYNVEGTGSF